jgi:hypothetical protein
MWKCYPNPNAPEYPSAPHPPWARDHPPAHDHPLRSWLYADQYDLSGGSIRSFERIDTVFKAANSLLYVRRYSTVCVSATSTRNPTRLAQIPCDLHGQEKCWFLVLVVTLHVLRYCTSILSTYVRPLCM